MQGRIIKKNYFQYCSYKTIHKEMLELAKIGIDKSKLIESKKLEIGAKI